MGKLKVLCIHGYRQNDKIFRERSGGFRKLFKRYIDFTFVSAPHSIPEPENLARAEGEQERGWWFSRPGDSYNALDNTDICTGYRDSLKVIREKIASEGPFDGVLGFSQGASFLSLLCPLRNDPPSGVSFKFAIFIAGFRSKVAPHANIYKEPIDCPSFHIIGSTDGVIPTQSSEELFSSFVNGTAYRHDGGHYIPASPSLRTALLEFLAPYIETSQ